jgi:hypothetical protein
MKTLLISIAMSLVSSLSLASGFVCEGQGYTVRMYNQVQPSQGTKNPAALIVSSGQLGTIAVVKGSDIQLYQTNQAFVYTGVSHDKHTGRFINVELAVSRSTQDNAGEPERLGHLKLTADGGDFAATLVCEQYLKN